MPGGPAEALDRVSIGLARDAFRLLSRAVTSLKLFPPRHATVLKFVDDLYALLEAYFAGHEELEVVVREHAFLMGEEVILEEENIAKSLPYFFHKDGMQKFALLKGIEKAELREFLNLIRQTSLVPLDESDIVTSIWEKDFSNIRIFAPDEHLLSKIDVFARRPLDELVEGHERGIRRPMTELKNSDRESVDGIYQGRIDLSVDDLRDVQSQRLTLGLMEQEDPARAEEMVAVPADEEKDAIEAMLAEARRTPPEVDFHEMIFELLSLEDKPERIGPILTFLEGHHRTLIQEGKFTFVVQFLNQTQELKRLCAETRPEKAAQLDKFLIGLNGALSADVIRESIRVGNYDSLPALFQFLELRGPQAVPLAVELLDETQDADTRRAAAEFIEKVSANDIDILASQLQDQRPAITLKIIELLGRSPIKKALSYLAAVTSYSNKEIRLAAVDVLGASAEPLAHRILATLVQDGDEGVALAAVERLRWAGDERIVERILRMVASRRFGRSGPRFKTAVFSFLVRTGSPEALGAIRRLLERRGVFGRSGRLAAQLSAVEALAGAGTREASEILRSGLTNSNKTLREACRNALERAASGRPATHDAKR